MEPITETKRRGRPKDTAPAANFMTDEQKKELEETRQILAQIKRAAEENDSDIDSLTADDVLRNINSKKDRKRYYKLLSQGKIINDENANDQIEYNALAKIKSLKKEAKAINAAIKSGRLPDEEVANQRDRLEKIDKAIEKEKVRAAELMRRLEN